MADEIDLSAVCVTCMCFAVELMCELPLLRWRLNLHREIRDIVHMHCCGAHVRTVPTNGVAWACIAVLLSASWVLWYGSCSDCIRCREWLGHYIGIIASLRSIVAWFKGARYLLLLQFVLELLYCCPIQGYGSCCRGG